MFNAILWPVDGSPRSFAPMQSVIDLARLSDATVVVLSVAEPRLYRAADASARAAGEAVEAAHIDTARHQVNLVCTAVQHAGVRCDAMVALSARPGAEIVKVASLRHCDLIVMATRASMGGIEALLDSSCTREVINASPVPVLVWPLPERA